MLIGDQKLSYTSKHEHLASHILWQWMPGMDEYSSKWNDYRKKISFIFNQNSYFSSKVSEEYSPMMSGHSERKKEKGNFRWLLSLIPESNTFVLWEISLPSNQISSASASQNWLEKEVKLMSYRDENEYYQEVWFRLSLSLLLYQESRSLIYIVIMKIMIVS